MAGRYACQGEVSCRRKTLLDSSWCLSGMPGAASSPATLVKESMLVAAVVWAAHGAQQPALLGILLVIVAYQLVGTRLESLSSMDLRRVLSERPTHPTKEQTK